MFNISFWFIQRIVQQLIQVQSFAHIIWRGNEWRFFDYFNLVQLHMLLLPYNFFQIGIE